MIKLFTEGETYTDEGSVLALKFQPIVDKFVAENYGEMKMIEVENIINMATSLTCTIERLNRRLK